MRTIREKKSKRSKLNNLWARRRRSSWSWKKFEINYCCGNGFQRTNENLRQNDKFVQKLMKYKKLNWSKGVVLRCGLPAKKKSLSNSMACARTLVTILLPPIISIKQKGWMKLCSIEEKCISCNRRLEFSRNLQNPAKKKGCSGATVTALYSFRRFFV